MYAFWGRRGAHERGSGCCLREFRASADARVPFPQGKGTKGCRGPARIPCGAPAPGPPSDKRLASVEPRRGAPDGVPSGSALTAPLKTFRFQRGPVLRKGKSWRGGRASHVAFLLYMERIQKASPERGGQTAEKRHVFKRGYGVLAYSKEIKQEKIALTIRFIFWTAAVRKDCSYMLRIPSMRA